MRCCKTRVVSALCFPTFKQVDKLAKIKLSRMRLWRTEKNRLKKNGGSRCVHEHVQLARVTRAERASL